MRPSPVAKSYSEAPLWAVLKHGKDLRPSHASRELAMEARICGVLWLSNLGPLWALSVVDIASSPGSTSVLKAPFKELWTYVNCEYRMTALRPHEARGKLCFAPTLPSQFVSFRDGYQVIRNGCQDGIHDKNSFVTVITY